MKVETKQAAAGAQGTANNPIMRHPVAWTAVLLVIVLCIFFRQSFLPNKVVYGNDDPLGMMAAQQTSMPSILSGLWADLNWFGNEGLSPSPTVTSALLLMAPPRVFMNIFYAAALFIVGIGACYCFRRFKLAPMACILGGLAAALNCDFFSTACWGVATQIIGIGASYFALGLLAGGGGSGWRRWVRIILAGMAVGLGVVEAYDIGALFSLFVAAYVLFQALFLEEASPLGKRIGKGAVRLAVVAGFAVLIAVHALSTLVETQIKGIANTAQDESTKKQQWAAATQWSVPKAEILQVLIPGVFGYRQQWHMYEDDQPKEDQYWGSIGAGGDLKRLIGTGFYAGVPVVAVALWGIFQSFRKRGSPFSQLQRRSIWFWTAMLIIAALMSFGKFAPFYQLFYALPYASTIRNPAKFMHVFSWVLVILFAYGMHGLAVAYLQNPVNREGGIVAQFKNWRARAAAFDRKWLNAAFASIPVALLAWLIYASTDSNLQSYMRSVGISGEDAPGVAQFSIQSVGWFILFLVLTVGWLALVFSGQFACPRGKWAGVLLGILLAVDLGRADLPWLRYSDVDYKFASDPIIKFLADKPYEHRVAMFPVGAISEQHARLINAYGSAWKQQLFPYYNIQCAEIVQEPRVATDKDEFLSALPQNSLFNLFRYWELSATRYILTPGGDFITQMGKQLGPVGKQFRVLKTFDLVPKRPNPSNWPVDWSAKEDPNGQLAILEFTGALPRAKLFSNWQVNTNDADTLHTVASQTFDPQKTVLVADAISGPAAADTNKEPGDVNITSYKPKRIELDADAKTPSVLLMADRFNPKWQVWVDDKPEKLLRCNFIQRGVYLSPGKHHIVFHFAPPMTSFYISLAVVCVGLLLVGCLVFTKDDEPAAIPAKPNKDKSWSKDDAVRGSTLN